MNKCLLFLISRLVSKISIQGIGISGLSIQKTNSFKGFSRTLIVFAVTFVAINLFCFSSAFANKRVTGVTYGTQTGTANCATGTSVTYTLTLSQTSGVTPSADNILLTWASGTPTGVTWNFTSGTEAVTSGNTTTPSFTPSGTNGSTIIFTVTTSNSTPAGSYGFTISITDNNGGGGPYTSNGLTLLVNAVAPTISYTGSPFTYYTSNTITSLTPTVTNIPTSYSISPALPAGLAFSTTTGVISGTPTATHGATTYTITATNAIGSGNTTISITVLASTISYTGSPFTYNIYTAITPLSPTATGGSPTGYSISPALPAGLSINAGTGVISGSSTVLSAATIYTITATYANGPNATASISITVNKAVLTITADNQNMVYGSAVPTLTVTYSGFVNGDTQANLTPQPTVITTGTSSSNIGTYPITPSGAVAPSYYIVNYVAGTLTITAKVLTITGLTANNKTYDRTTTATLSGTAALSGVVGADVITLGGSPTSTFATANAGVGVTVTVTGYTISGVNAGNYTLTQPTLTATINQKTLTVTGASASNKVYDGTTTATITGGVLTGIIAPDAVSVSTTGTFASPNVANGIAVTILLTGASAGNYILTQPGATANITVAPLTITATSVSKVYGTLLASGPGSVAFTSSGLKNGETIGSVTMTYGTGGAVHDAVGSYVGHITPTAATGGTFTASNYSISYISGNITVTAAPLTITGLSANNKAYDRTTTATMSGTATLNGVVAGDVLTLGGTPTFTFATANVGTGIVVTVAGYTISGAAAGNYTLAQPSGFTANITAVTLTIAGAAASNKVYDGTATATITGTLTGVVAGDVITLNPSGTFPSKNIGTGLAVTPSCTISGANAGNYILTQPVGLTANITAKPLTITGVTVSNKVYDGTTAGSLSGSSSLSGVIAGDVVTLGGAGTAVFASKDVGTGIAVTVSSYSLSGTDAGNYTLTQPSGLTANITPASLSITAIGPLKVTGFSSPVQVGATSNFIYYGTVNGETITSVTLTPSPTTSQTTGSSYTVTPSAATGANGYIASNYTITYLAFSGTVAGFSYVWTGNSGTAWGTSTNWSPNGVPGSTDNVSIPATANAPNVTANTSVNTITITGNNTITISSGKNLVVNSGFNVNSGVTAANIIFSGSSTSTVLEFNSAIFANYGTFNLSGTGIFQIDANGSFIYNSGTFTAGGDVILYLQGGSNTTHALTNSGTFYAGTSGSACNIEMDDYGSIDNSGNFYLGPTSQMYYYNDAAQYVIVNNQSGGKFTLQSDATGSATIGEIPQGKNNAYTGTFNVERYFQGGNTYSVGRYVERSYRIISSCVNTGTTVNGNYVFGLNYIVGATAGQTTTASSATNAFITGCTGGSTSAGNPSVYLYNESLTPSDATYISGNFLGITNIINSTTGGTISASNGGTYSLPVGTGTLFFFRGAATNWSTRTVFPYIAPENVTLTSTGNLNVGPYTFKNWYTPASSNIGYTGSGTGTNYAVRGFNMIGNPYPSTIDWNTCWSGSTGLVRTNVAPTIWVFNPATYQYDTYMATSSSGGVATGNASRYIASGQGFIVQATGSSPKLTIDEYAKGSLNNNGSVGKVSSAPQLTGSSLLMGSPVQGFIPQMLRLKLAVDSISYDDIVVSFNANATRTYDPNEDAKYIPGIGASEGLASFSDDNVKLSINTLRLPNEGTQLKIKLHVVGSKSGVYTFKRTQLDAIPQVYDVWLMDKYKKDSLDIRHNTTYRFNINLADTASFGDNRFSIVLRQQPGFAVHLLNFTANKSTSGSQINWVTDNEQNYTKFTVERSTDGGSTYGLIGGLSSTAVGNYSMLDKNPAIGSDTYRLKIEDMNGAISYSSPVTLIYGNSGNSASNINVYPNPAVGVINLVINQNTSGSLYTSGFSALQNANSGPVSGAPQTSNSSKSYNIRITTMSGLVIMNSTSAASTWQNNVSNLAPGTYIVQVLNSTDNSLVGKTTFVKL